MTSPAGRVREKTAIVTGAGSGVGRATAVLLAQEGATVMVVDIDMVAAREVTAEISEDCGRAESVQMNVGDEAAWASLTTQVLSTYGKLDILVNNAGIASADPVAEATLERWRSVMNVNLDGVFLGTKYGIQAMRKGNGGSIINIASVSGIKPSPGASAYCASKAAVRMFSKTAAIECADAELGIRVNLVTPGGVKTPMWEQMDFFQELVVQHGGTDEAFAAMSGTSASQRFYSSADVAQAIFYFASDESSHLSGTELVMDRGHTL